MNKPREEVSEHSELLEKAEELIQDTEAFLEEKKKGGWGGARSNSGPKPIMGESAKHQVGYRITATQKAALEAEQQEGESLNQAARRLLLEKLDLS